MGRKIQILAAVTFILTVLVVGASAQAQQAMAELKNATGQVVGNATFTQQSSGVRVTVQVKGLPPGMHGIHIHAAAKCDPPDFTSAGSHFNPFARKHGLQSPNGPHAGDMPNLVVGQDGSGSFDNTNTLLTLAAGATNSLFKPNGTALVIHANPDDEVTDPTGNSGARIACGLIVASAAAPSLLDQYGLAIAAVVVIVVVVAVGAVLVRRGKPKTT